MRFKVGRLGAAAIALGIASLVTVPWEIISRLRKGHFALRGYGFLPSAAGLGVLALGLYYAIPAFQRSKTLLSLYFKHDIKLNNTLGNLQLIQQAAEHHFKALKNIAQPDPASAPNLGVLPELIHLHYLKLYCRILSTTPADRRVEKKMIKAIILAIKNFLKSMLSISAPLRQNKQNYLKRISFLSQYPIGNPFP